MSVGDISAVLRSLDFFRRGGLVRIDESGAVLTVRGGDTANCDGNGLEARVRKRLTGLTKAGDTIAGCSSPQQGFWLLDKLKSGDPGLCVFSVLRIEGRIDLECVYAGAQMLVRRHEALRTTILEFGGMPLLRIAARSEPEFVVRRLDDSHNVLAIVTEEVRRPFNLRRGPLFRNLIVQESDTVTWLMTCVHHIVSDGWSMEIMLRDFARCYEAAAGVETPAFRRVSQISDLADWEHEFVESERGRRSAAFWVDALREESPPLLPDMPEDAESRGRMVRHDVPAEAWENLCALARKLGTSPFTISLSLFALYVRGHFDRDSFVIGVPVAQRTKPASRWMLGPLLHLIPIRFRIDLSQTGRDFVQKYHERITEALEHSGISLERVRQCATATSDAFRGRIQVLFNFVNVPESERRLGEFPLAKIEIEDPPVMYPLTLYVRHARSGPWLELRCAQCLFDQSEATDFLQGYADLLRLREKELDSFIQAARMPKAKQLNPWNRTPPSSVVRA